MAKLLVKIGDNPGAQIHPSINQDGDVISRHDDGWTPARGELEMIERGMVGVLSIPGVHKDQFDSLMEPKEFDGLFSPVVMVRALKLNLASLPSSAKDALAYGFDALVSYDDVKAVTIERTMRGYE